MKAIQSFISSYLNEAYKCHLEQVNKTNADGVNFDYESVIMPDEKEKRDNYVAYVNETSRALQALLGEDRAQVK